MVLKRENINNRNIKFLEIRDRGKPTHTYIKSSNKWYSIKHESKHIIDIEKASLKDIDYELSWIKEPGYFRVYDPTEKKKYDNTPIPSHPNASLVFYDIKTGNPYFFYGNNIKITFRQIVKNYTKIRNKIHSSDEWIFRSKFRRV